MSKKLWSVFTDDMDHCFYTGSPCVERHHIFGGPCRTASEKYGFVIPLRPDIHPNGVSFNPRHSDIDKKLKQMAQQYFEKHYGSREKFIKIFIKSYL